MRNASLVASIRYIEVEVLKLPERYDENCLSLLVSDDGVAQSFFNGSIDSKGTVVDHLELCGYSSALIMG